MYVDPTPTTPIIGFEDYVLLLTGRWTPGVLDFEIRRRWQWMYDEDGPITPEELTVLQAAVDADPAHYMTTLADQLLASLEHDEGTAPLRADLERLRALYD